MKLFKSLLIVLTTAIPHHTECMAETSLGKVILKVVTTIIMFDTQSTPIPTTIGMQKKVWTTYAPGTLDALSEFVTDNEKTKEVHRELTDYLQHPDQYAGKKISRGVLIEGPRNARAAQFVGDLVHKSRCTLIAVNGSQLIEADDVKSLFEEARHTAPSIIFIDELDAMPRTTFPILEFVRGYTYTTEPTSNAHQLLVEVCNLAEYKQTFAIIATINNAGSIDESFKVCGRFDQILSL